VDHSDYEPQSSDVTLPQPVDDSKPRSTFLAPPQQKHGLKAPFRTELHIDTSTAALGSTSSPVAQEVTPTMPLEFREAGEETSPISPVGGRRLRCWPHSILPSPYALYITLFPTTRDFQSKNLFGKVVAILAIPAVFLLTITLPVVDSEALEPDEEITIPRMISPVSAFPETATSEIRPLEEIAKRPVVMGWNRWLTCVQCLCAPVFLTLIFFGTPL
jgi:solute carrier family 24 (sodium/potassium/calcium exchanger), member 6